MRYYAVVISGAGSAFPETPGALIPGAQFCSVIQTGRGPWGGLENDPSALQCQMQFEVSAADRSGSQGFLRLYGIDLSMIDQAAKLTNCPIDIYGGFWLGLDLATWEYPHAGLLYKGLIISSYGNWEGSAMTLDLVIASGMPSSSGGGDGGGGGGGGGGGAGGQSASRLIERNRRIGGRPRPAAPVVMPFDGGGLSLGDIGASLSDMAASLAGSMGGGWGTAPLNLIHDMKKGTPLDSAIKQTLTTAMPGFKFVNLMKGGLTLPYHDAGFYQTVAQHMGYIKQLSKDLVGDKKYPGVSLFAHKGMLLAYDRSQAYNTIELQAWDLIGQPTWGGQDGDTNDSFVNFKVPMRADIFPGCTVVLPQTWSNVFAMQAGGVSSAGVASQDIRGRLAFMGPVNLMRVLIIGDSRNPAGESWCLSCTGAPEGGSGQTAAATSPASSAMTAGDATPGEGRLLRRRRGVG